MKNTEGLHITLDGVDIGAEYGIGSAKGAGAAHNPTISTAYRTEAQVAADEAVLAQAEKERAERAKRKAKN